MSQELAAVLRGSGILTSRELELSIRQATARSVSLWDILVNERRVSEEALAHALSTHLNLPRVRIDSIDIDATAVKAVAAWIVRKHTCLPIRLEGKNLILAMMNPLDQQAKQDVQFASSRHVAPVVACRHEILTGIDKYYPPTSARPSEPEGAEEIVFSAVTTERGELNLDLTDPLKTGDPAPAVYLCSQIVNDAVDAHASDIHIEPGPHDMRVRLRVDGVLRDYTQLPRWMHAALVSRIKILAKLDISRQRLPQDGRIKVRSHDRGIDLRVSTLPTQLGEKVVMRVLGSTAIPTLTELGLSADQIDALDDALNQPQGLVLVTGPTGAGKSTTLYSMLARRHSPDVNITTIEDPIEYQLPGISQVQVDVKAGLTFAACLRSILRQDPDVILVGEIRDAETAEIAFQAALTGHLVFTTLHTNSSLTAIERLLDLDVRPLLLTSATNLVIAQRLARRICINCREPYVPSASALRRLHIEACSQEFHRGRGCALCGHTGYSGRVGIFEILRLTPRLKELVIARAPESELMRAAMAAGVRFLLEDARDKVRQRLTTVEEILRVVRIEHGDGHAAVASSGLMARDQSVS